MIPEAQALAVFLNSADRFTVVSGAGVSTGSGIPDYRDRDGNWKHTRPMQYSEFAGSHQARRRYWARSFAGWSRMAEARPNRAHEALAALEAAGKVETLITQNVDGLHSRAGSRNVIDLHGRLSNVRCLTCGTNTSRDDWQQRLADSNPNWRRQASFFAPDGDAGLEGDDVHQFNVPACGCGGIMKPDVVFFGENVPKKRVHAAMEATDRTDALLVVGSSLMVFSGYRFAKRAAEAGKPVGILNRGCTRADDIAALKIDANCEDVLAHVSDHCV
jgi:NAD-dependent SIR2 family protein deacetylase